MENLEGHNDDSENNAKVSDSAYSNSCSNSQSRRSSKSTHFGSNSSGSSGYGGQPSSSDDSCNILDKQCDKKVKEKETKQKKITQIETASEAQPDFENKVTIDEPEKDERSAQAPVISEEYGTLPLNDGQKIARAAVVSKVPVTNKTRILNSDIVVVPISDNQSEHYESESMDIVTSDKSIKDELIFGNINNTTLPNFTRGSCTDSIDGFSCVISMHDGVVMYTTTSLTSSLGFPKDMWIGRSFIDFIHPKDRNTFAAQITNGLVLPKRINSLPEKEQCRDDTVSSMFCRIRKYRGLNTSGFGVREAPLIHMPFLLKLTFKNIANEGDKATYLVVEATQCLSAFKTPNEVITNAIPFVIRHIANGTFEYLDPESVSYLGYLPQDVVDKNALQLYHPDDLCYIKQIYETIVKEGEAPRSKSYRLLAQNGDYVKIETEWSSFVNPWSRKLEVVIGKHHIVEGPTNPDVFLSPDLDVTASPKKRKKIKSQYEREGIVKIMNEILTKPAEVAKKQMSKRCQDLAVFMESLMKNITKTENEPQNEIYDLVPASQERDTVMLGGISSHNDTISGMETPLSYNQLNNNDNLQRFFDRHEPCSTDQYKIDLKQFNTRLTARATKCYSPMAQYSADSGDGTSSGESSAIALLSTSDATSVGDCKPTGLTEVMLNNHNLEMEKELIRKYRELYSGHRREREMMAKEMQQKKKEHIARCAAIHASITQPRGLKRGLHHLEHYPQNKHHKASHRQPRRRQTGFPTTIQQTPAASNAIADYWPPTLSNGMNTMINNLMPNVGYPHPPYVNPIAGGVVPGMYPMFYMPAAAPMNGDPMTSQNTPNFLAPVEPVIYPQQYGAPLVYSAITPQVYPSTSYAAPANTVVMGPGNMMLDTSQNMINLTGGNYEMVCNSYTPYRPNGPPQLNPTNNWGDKINISETQVPKQTFGEALNVNNILSTSAFNMINKKVPETLTNDTDKTIEPTDVESSYSSFYSSFLKTPKTFSAEDTSYVKEVGNTNGKRKVKYWKDTCGGMPLNTSINATNKTHSGEARNDIIVKAKRKIEPPWLKQVCMTSDVVYKYQIPERNKDEVLASDKQKVTQMVQPSLVNEQLGQLYYDMDLAGVAEKLSLEEGSTSSVTSGEETNPEQSSKFHKQHGRLGMIYQEDAPLPSPELDDNSK